jgi:hypothetical protein
MELLLDYFVNFQPIASWQVIVQLEIAAATNPDVSPQDSLATC